MLLEDHVNVLYIIVRIRVVRRKVTHENAGEYFDNGKNLVEMYLTNIDSIEEFDKTLIHKFIHARNDLCNGYENVADDDEEAVEQEAIDTYTNKPDIVKQIKELYDLRKVTKLISQRTNGLETFIRNKTIS